MQIGLVALLDIPAYNYVRQLQIELRDLFGVRETLKLEPHFTIKYAINTDNLTEFEEYFDNLLKETEEFDIEIQGVNYFDNNVVFLDIVKNDFLTNFHLKILKDLGEKFSVKPGEYEGENLKFHITLAYKDISQDQFLQIKEYLKTKNPDLKIAITQFAIYLDVEETEDWLIYKVGELQKN